MGRRTTRKTLNEMSVIGTVASDHQNVRPAGTRTSRRKIDLKSDEAPVNHRVRV